MKSSRAKDIMTHLDKSIRSFKSFSEICCTEEIEEVGEIWAKMPVTSSVYDVLRAIAAGE